MFFHILFYPIKERRATKWGGGGERTKTPRTKATADKSPKKHMLCTVESTPGTKFRGRLVASKTFSGINFRGRFAEKISWV